MNHNLHILTNLSDTIPQVSFQAGHNFQFPVRKCEDSIRKLKQIGTVQTHKQTISTSKKNPYITNKTSEIP